MVLTVEEMFFNLHPVRLGAEEVQRYKASGLVRSEMYLSQLINCLSDSQYSLFHDPIQAILSCGATIEQEVFYNSIL